MNKYIVKHGIKQNNLKTYPYRFETKESTSKKELEEFIRSIYSGEVIHSNRKLLNGRELDIYLPSLNIAFEYNGVYYHSDVFKDKNFHLKKTEDCLDKGIKLFHIFEDDWAFRKEIVQSRIKHLLGLAGERVYGRKTTIVDLEAHTKNKFLNDNHLQGKDKANVKLGLLYKGDVVACMTFVKARFRKDVEWELSRFAVKKTTSVIGGFQKLLKHFIKHYDGSIVSYADRSYSFGDVYEKNGFTLERINPPSYKYISSQSLQRLNRQSFTKKAIARKFEITEGTEKEIMTSLGFCRIYDCGTLTYILNKVCQH